MPVLNGQIPDAAGAMVSPTGAAVVTGGLMA